MASVSGKFPPPAHKPKPVHIRETRAGSRSGERESRERREEVNRKVASQKAISIILRREATKAVIEKKKGHNTKKLLPRTVLEALHDRITALRWDSALKGNVIFVGDVAINCWSRQGFGYFPNKHFLPAFGLLCI